MNKRKTIISNQDPAFLRLQEVQARYNVGRVTARKLAEESGSIVKVGRCVLVDIERLDAYLETLRTTPEA